VKLETAYAGFPPDPETGAPAWNGAYNQLWAQEQERAIVERMEAIDEKVALPGGQAADWVSAAYREGGTVMDPEAARSHPCTRINLGEGRKPQVHAKGIVGALSDEQIATYCVDFVDVEATPAQRARLGAFADASHSCSIETKDAPHATHMDLYFSCIGKELRAKGIEA